MNKAASAQLYGERLRCCLALGPVPDPESAAYCERLVTDMLGPVPPGSKADREATALIDRVHWWFGPAEFASHDAEAAARRDLLQQASVFERDVAEIA